MGRKNIERTDEEKRELNAKRQREYYAKNSVRLAARKMELYYEKKERNIQDKDKS